MAKTALGLPKMGCRLATLACGQARTGCRLAKLACGLSKTACGLPTLECGLATTACTVYAVVATPQMDVVSSVGLHIFTVSLIFKFSFIHVC